jgi:hypothetical protein
LGETGKAGGQERPQRGHLGRGLRPWRRLQQPRCSSATPQCGRRISQVSQAGERPRLALREPPAPCSLCTVVLCCFVALSLQQRLVRTRRPASGLPPPTLPTLPTIQALPMDGNQAKAKDAAQWLIDGHVKAKGGMLAGVGSPKDASRSTTIYDDP